MSDETAAERRARMKAEWDENQKGGKGGGSGNGLDETKEGKNTRRILPKRDPEDVFYETYAMHFNIGPDKSDSHLCIEPGGPFGGASQADKARDKKRGYRAKLCPSCKNFCKRKKASLKFKFGSEEGIRYWSERVVQWRAKRQYVFAVTRPKSKKPLRIYVHKCGVMIGQPLLEAYYDADSGGDFTHPETGRNIVITKKSLSKKDATNVEYKVQITPDRIALENWKKLRKRLPDLKTFIPDALSPEAIQALIDAEPSDDDDDDDVPRSKKRRDRDGSTTDDDDGEEREVRTHKRKRGKDEDVDPNAAEESDDEPKKKKSKKSRMRDKLERRANRDKDL